MGPYGWVLRDRLPRTISLRFPIGRKDFYRFFLPSSHHVEVCPTGLDGRRNGNAEAYLQNPPSAEQKKGTARSSWCENHKEGHEGGGCPKESVSKQAGQEWEGKK